MYSQYHHSLWVDVCVCIITAFNANIIDLHIGHNKQQRATILYTPVCTTTTVHRWHSTAALTVSATVRAIFLQVEDGSEKYHSLAYRHRRMTVFVVLSDADRRQRLCKGERYVVSSVRSVNIDNSKSWSGAGGARAAPGGRRAVAMVTRHRHSDGRSQRRHIGIHSDGTFVSR